MPQTADNICFLM